MNRIQESILLDRMDKGSERRLLKAYNKYKRNPTKESLLYLQKCVANKGAMEELRKYNFELYDELKTFANKKWQDLNNEWEKNR